MANLTKNELKILVDMQSFITFAVITDKQFKWTLANLSHDCWGILNEEPCFLPRSSGYSEYLTHITGKKLKEKGGA
ncbi:hypothetical protein ES708_17915 [subsurface metagenome]